MLIMSKTMGRAAVAALGALALAAAPAQLAQAQQTWSFTLSGANETPPNPSTATGRIFATLTGTLLRFEGAWSGLSGPTTMAHIHCCTAVPFTGAVGVATTVPSLPGFPLGVLAGTLNTTLDLSLPGSWNPAFVTANGGTLELATQRLVQGMNEGRAYFNIHTTVYPGGEINGFASVVPEPSTYALFAAGLAGVGLVARRRRA